MKIKDPDWYANASKVQQTLEGVMIGNQVILRLANGHIRKSYGRDKYFVVQDEKTGWWFLVWDLNTAGDKFHGQFNSAQDRPAETKGRGK